jgi:uncharacterized protein YndB with AHSA1/START domain
MMKWILIAGVLVVVLVVAALVVGWLLPEKHHATRHATLPASPEAVWALMTDVDAFPTWRSDVKRVERLPDRAGRPVWIEHGSGGRVTFAVDESDPPRRLVVRIADRDLPFGGTWTYNIAPVAGGASLTIIEDGAIYNPLFRVMARFVFGYESTMSAYLAAAQRRLARP